MGANGKKLFDGAWTYTVYGHGEVLLEQALDPVEGLPQLPQIGFETQLPKSFTRFTWDGRGPHETYPDRKLSGTFGVYEQTVAPDAFPYEVPQEYDNKTDVRWAALRNARGLGLLAIAVSPLQAKALPYSTHQITEATNRNILYVEDTVTLHLDFEACGLGSASCGPANLPQYVVEPKPFRHAVRLRALDDADAPVALAKLGLAE
jgi:beta-galactosidase/evolved beta-galactosidase subunit alpha